ncbi:hypothetical protein [Amycolatopsis magusensis]|uniref:hypothetical protein n=1 Tax=Amycolatopsis magusensis TaxID=882444 RepID=UPI0037B87E3E
MTQSDGNTRADRGARGEVKKFWYTAGALGIITTILTVVLTKCASDEPVVGAPVAPASSDRAAPPAPSVPSAPATSAATASTTPSTPLYQKEPPSLIRIPFPDCYTFFDLDGPKVVGNSTGSDLTYESCGYTGSLSHYSQSALGVGPASEPAEPEECVRAAQGQALDRVEKDDLIVGKTFCAVTDEANVVWLKLTKKTGKQDEPDLEFEMVRWLQPT